jgi:hypothetical protein
VYFSCYYARNEGISRSGGIAPLILNLGTRWKCTFSFAFHSLNSRRNICLYLSSWSLAGLQSRSGRFVVEKNFLPVPWIQSRSFCCPAFCPTSLVQIFWEVRMSSYQPCHQLCIITFQPPSLCTNMVTMLKFWGYFRQIYCTQNMHVSLPRKQSTKTAVITQYIRRNGNIYI